ncbi:MAG: UDP-N-acetylmuramoyl-L-alanine--D-glutamate ligase [Rickettsiales bacterium]|nr:UDP-N-acetylmuramoyl-L-alanine--D-glutamate ligase [Rickettsiales bacterium]
MPVITSWAGKFIGVVGLKRSGLGAIKLLKASKAQVYAWDDNERMLDAFRQSDLADGVTIAPPATFPWERVTALVLSPGIPLTHPQPHVAVQMARRAGCRIICDIELLYMARPDAKYIGITGTNGKSTTTILTWHLCKHLGMRALVGGNIGVSAAELAEEEADIFVLELSSYQLELLRDTRLDIAVLLNISEDHLDRHGGMAGYMAAKRKIFQYQNSGATAIIGIDDGHSRALLIEQKAAGNRRVVPISFESSVPDGIFVQNRELFDATVLPEQAYPMPDTFALRGQHNAQNAVAAFAALRALGAEGDAIMRGMKTFPGLAHRMEFIQRHGKLVFINDSKATNADAAAQALRSYKNIYWLAGGLEKVGGITSLVPMLGGVKKAFLFGQAQENFRHTLHGKVPCQKCGSLEQALEIAIADAQADIGEEDAIILLSPGGASFDAYANFEARGEHFRALVKAYLESMRQQEAG